MLRQCRLRQAEWFLQGAGGKFASAELAQDQEPLLVAERAQQPCRPAGAGFEVRERECLQVHYVVYITLLANVAIANI